MKNTIRVICAAIALAGCSSKPTTKGSAAAGGGPFANAATGTIGKGGAGNGGNGAGASGAPGATGAPRPAAGTTCPSPGMTQTCCGTGTQTCAGQVEFATWSVCTDSKGTILNCSSDSPCGPGEFGPTCGTGGSAPPPPTCTPGEPGCPGGPPPALCSDESISNEPEILVGYEPANGQSVSADGQIKVWVTDERAAIIAANEQVDPMTGAITSPGDRTATAPDKYLWEPALYIAPQTAESGGTPHFPQVIKGWYNNVPPAGGQRPPAGAGVQVPGMDTPPQGAKLLMYTTEYIWNVRDLNLPPGTYTAEFVIHDGDRDRAVGCVTIVVTQ